MTRGTDNNNPGSIDFHETVTWVGQVGLETGHVPNRFVKFDTPFHGLRALALVLLAYQRKHGLTTIDGIIDRWAPADENDAAAYVDDVCERCGVGPDDTINLEDPLLLAKLVTAIVHHENGGNPYAATLIANAVDAALARGKVG